MVTKSVITREVISCKEICFFSSNEGGSCLLRGLKGNAWMKTKEKKKTSSKDTGLLSDAI